MITLVYFLQKKIDNTKLNPTFKLLKRQNVKILYTQGCLKRTCHFVNEF